MTETWVCYTSRRYHVQKKFISPLFSTRCYITMAKCAVRCDGGERAEEALKGQKVLL